MSRRIDYYFSMISPWAYIGHALFGEIARRHGVAIAYKPVALGGVFAETGGLPLGRRHPARQRYRIFELQRWREKRGLRFHLHPKFWPFDVALADRMVIAAVAAGHDPDGFVRRGFAAVWEDERDLADEGNLVALADAAGLPGADLLAAAKGEPAGATYEQNARDAIVADAFGSPCYVLDGEVFWGQDRLELLDDALTSERKPYRSDA